MELRNLEEIDQELTEAISKNDTTLVLNLYNELANFDERYINMMPETVYARYLSCLDRAK